MKFLIISHTPHKQETNRLYAYGPYVREMNRWLNHVDEATVVAPKMTGKISNIDLDYQRKNVQLKAIPSINFLNVKSVISSMLKIPKILYVLFRACKKADHIHLRCPGNIGLLGCVVQVFFPYKMKTAKYAGNWDPDSNQPLSYKFQRWILGNTTLTRNMQVLIYGNWKNQTKNIKPFFTATYSKAEIIENSQRQYNNLLRFVFIGSLVKGKRPLLAVKMIESLANLRRPVNLEIYGDGPLKREIENYVNKKGLQSIVTLRGNKSKEVIAETLKKTHFLILPSNSEGWPKVITEAMFFGTIPIATKVSCIPDILDHGKRGILIEADLISAVNSIVQCLGDEEGLNRMSKLAAYWARMYTLEVFEDEVVNLLKTSDYILNNKSTE